MGSGASASARASKSNEDDPPPTNGDEEEEDHSAETRSLPWRRAWRALLDYTWTEDETEYEIHPELDAKEKVELCLLEHGYEARSAPGFISGRCLLHLAAERGAEMCCIALLEAGTPPDVPDKYQDTPMHCAAKDGRQTIVKLLIEFGGDVLLKNKHEKTPLQWAQDFDQTSIIKILKEAGGDPPIEYHLPLNVNEELADDLMLSVQQVSQYHEAFVLFDEDGSGELDTEELGNVIRSIGFQVSEAEVVDMVEESDEDRSGALDFIEFLELMARRFGSLMHELTEEEHNKGKETLKQALNEFDSDNSGTLSYTEYMNAMMNYGEPLTDSQAQEILTNLDVGDSEFMDIDYDALADVLSSR